jgi:aspartate/methionine/tyrosine aminotransferase
VPLSDELKDWIHAHPDLMLKPASPKDVAAFRQSAIAYLSAEYGEVVDEQHIVPVPSGRVGMSAFIACVVEPGSGVVVTEPGYPAFARMARHRHAVVHSILLDPKRNFAPDLDALSAAGANAVRVIALNYPNNPTAATLGAETRSLLEQAARKTKACIFNDAVYGPLIYEGGSDCLLSDAADDIDLVELHSLTKLYPLGPLSGSFLVGSADSIEEIAHYSEFAWAPMSALQTQVTTRCLQDAAGRHAIRTMYESQLSNLRRTLLAIGFEPFPTPSGIYALCRLPAKIAGSAISSAEHAATILLDDFDIAVVPWDVANGSYLRFCSMYLPADLERLAAVGDKLDVAYGDA